MIQIFKKIKANLFSYTIFLLNRFLSHSATFRLKHIEPNLIFLPVLSVLVIQRKLSRNK